ncbi:unnamed protein product, partial [Iphiclides podalirius]
MLPAQSNELNNDLCNEGPSSSMKWIANQQYSQQEIQLQLDSGPTNEIDSDLHSNEVTSAPGVAKHMWKRGRPVRVVHDRLLSLEEERIRIEKQKLLEKKRCNNIRLKMEKDRLEIERQRNILLEKLLVAVETVVNR